MALATNLKLHTVLTGCPLNNTAPRRTPGTIVAGLVLETRHLQYKVPEESSVLLPTACLTSMYVGNL